MAPTVAPDTAPLFKDRALHSAPTLVRKRINPIGIVLVVVALMLVLSGLAKGMIKPKEDVSTVFVIGAASDLYPGARIGFRSLHKLQIPKQYFSTGMFTSSEQLVGRTARLFVPEGEPISNDAVFAGTNGLSSALETHERAVTVRLDDEALIDHSIYPGDYVDVIATLTKDGKKCTKTICQEVRVLLSLTKEGTIAKTGRTNDANRITLACSPQQSEMLSEAAEAGKIRLALRSKLTRKVQPLEGVLEDDLLPTRAVIKPIAVQPKMPNFDAGIPAVLAPPPPISQLSAQGTPAAPPNPLGWIVEVFSGNHKESYAFPEQTK